EDGALDQRHRVQALEVVPASARKVVERDDLGDRRIVRSARQRLAPMNPAPPVTRTLNATPGAPPPVGGCPDLTRPRRRRRLGGRCRKRGGAVGSSGRTDAGYSRSTFGPSSRLRVSMM
ncbi:MAG: hypothetical protein ACLQPH_12270, partial [Acidimicrobiales bacterium]